MKNAFTLLEVTITSVIIAFLILATQYFDREIISNNIKGAQLSLLRLYEAERLYYHKYKEYTDKLEVMWEYQKRIHEYPVTIVDFRKRSIHKEKEPILHFRIDHYYIDIEVSKDKQKFKITAKVPTVDELSKELPVFSIDNFKNLTPKNKDKWLIKILPDIEW